MAVNSNYGYPPGPSSSSSLPYSSTPSNVRPQRPRFAYSGPPNYPRPRSSASKPNPDSFCENMGNKFGMSDGYMESTRNNLGVDMSYDTFQSQYSNAASYHNGPTGSFGNSAERYVESPLRSHYAGSSENCMDPSMRNKYGKSDAYMDSMMNNYGSSSSLMDNSYLSISHDPYPSNNSSMNSPNASAYFTCNESFYEPPQPPLFPAAANMKCSPAQTLQYPPAMVPFRNSAFKDDRPEFQGRFQNKKFSNSSSGNKPKTVNEKKPSIKKAMPNKKDWQCAVCSLDFTSSIPLEMHLRGAKHAKKLKLLNVLESLQTQVAENKEIATLGKSFRCDLCNIFANSSFQLQTHLDGSKHKAKLQQQQQSKEKKDETEVEGNKKSNGAATVRSLPPEFGEPQPAKMCKYSCSVCNVVVNSETQLQQHLTSKKHQAKVEGKPLPRKKPKQKKEEDDENNGEKSEEAAGSATETNAAVEQAKTEEITETDESTEARKMVMGVKTLAASFVQGDTLH